MKTLHTPGPWKACRSHEDFDGPYYNIDPEEQSAHDAKPFVSIKAANGENVASGHDLFTFKTANAHLIAAAPELLAALECMLEWDLMMRARFGAKYPLDLRPAPNMRTQECRAVLAKARGQ